MRPVLSLLQPLIWRLSFVLLLFSVSRIVFWQLNAAYFQGVELISFLGGIRFDLAVVCVTNSLLIIASLFPIASLQNNRVYRIALRVLFVLVNGLALAFDLSDAEYFKFTLKRSTSDLINMMGTGNDLFNLLPSFIADYWYLVLIWIFFLYLLWKVSGRTITRAIPVKGWKQWSTWALTWTLVVVLAVIGSRGGLQLKPLSLLNASSYGGNKYVPVVLNTPFAIIRTTGKGRLPELNYFQGDEARQIFDPVQRFSSDSLRRPNVVLIILESFAEEYIGALSGKKSFTPFLDSLINVSTGTAHTFANGRKSIEAVPAIISSLPAWMTSPYISSSYSANEINSLPRILKEFGYTSGFYHGGNNGTMGFDVFARTAAYDRYVGRNEYPDQADYDGQWGIYDEPFLQFCADQFDELPSPFFGTIFTLSSHHPYEVPEQYEGRFDKGTLPIHQTIGYADMALRKFFERASRSPWFGNTLFIITADHTHQSAYDSYLTKLGQYRVPLLFYSPQDSTRRMIEGVAQHADILPSLMDMIGYDGELICFGESIFREKRSGLVMNYLNGSYQINDDSWVGYFDGDRLNALYDYRNDTLLKSNVIEENPEIAEYLERAAKARIQQFNARMNQNALIIRP